MSRNGSGTYTLPEAAFVPNTPISSAAVNSDFSDIADALTDSLARDGQGGMTAVLPLANLGFTYLTDPNTGMRRTAADTQAISAGGIDIATFTSTTMTVTGTLDVVSTFKINGVAVFPLATANIADNAVTYAKIQEAAASRLIGNPTAGVTEVSEISLGVGLEFSGTTIKGVSVVPTIQRFLSGTAQTYTTPANVKWIRIRMVGGGGGGGEAGNTALSGAGVASTFSGGTLSAGGGGNAANNTGGGAGGTPTNGNVLSIPGGSGGGSNGATNGTGGNGGNSYFGGGGGGAAGGTVNGLAGATNTGGGGGGGSQSGTSAAGGGAGAYVEHIISAPAATYTYTVGTGGVGASGGGAGGGDGGNGAAGQIIVEEYY